MKMILARLLLTVSILIFVIATFFLWHKQEPFYTHYFLFAWWSAIGIADAWLYLKGGESLFIAKLIEFVTFLVPLSAVAWFIFEAFNLRIQNWSYINVPQEIWIRWPGYFFSFGTVLPGIFLAANLLDHYGIFRRNEFSNFFSMELPKPMFWSCVVIGLLMLLLPLALPKIFFPLVWGGFVLLLDPVNALWNGRSLIQEWRQKNWNRTLQLLLAGLICGFLWEILNFWAGAKWVYTVPLPDALMKELKIFEMPLLGFPGFPPFALECFVMTEFARNLREKFEGPIWKILVAGSVLFMLSMCRLIDQNTVRSFRG